MNEDETKLIMQELLRKRSVNWAKWGTLSAFGLVIPLVWALNTQVVAIWKAPEHIDDLNRRVWKLENALRIPDNGSEYSVKPDYRLTLNAKTNVVIDP